MGRGECKIGKGERRGRRAQGNGRLLPIKPLAGAGRKEPRKQWPWERGEQAAFGSHRTDLLTWPLKAWATARLHRPMTRDDTVLPDHGTASAVPPSAPTTALPWDLPLCLGRVPVTF